MKSIILLVAFVAAASAALPDTALWTDFVCRDGILGPNDDRMKDIGACAANSGPGKANSCVFFCHAKALGVLNADGLPSVATYDKWVVKTMPKEHHSLAKAWFQNCFEKYGKFIKKEDTSCVYANQFGDCTWSVQPKLTCPKA